MKRVLLVLALLAAALGLVAAPASAAPHNFGPIVQIGTILAPGTQETAHLPAVGGSGVHGDVLMKQQVGLFTVTGNAVGIKRGQVAVSVEYQNHSCALNGSESLADFIVGVWLPKATGGSRLVPLAKSTSTVQITGVNAISIRVVKVKLGAAALLAQLQAGNYTALNAIPTLAPAQACGVR